MQHLVPNLRYIGCMVYWDPQGKALAFEDRDRLIEMSSVASRAFERLLEEGRSLSDIGNADLEREVWRALAPSR